MFFFFQLWFSVAKKPYLDFTPGALEINKPEMNLLEFIPALNPLTLKASEHQQRDVLLHPCEASFHMVELGMSQTGFLAQSNLKLFDFADRVLIQNFDIPKL